MAKIKIISDRRPWVNGAPVDFGAEIETSAADADVLIAAGFAEAVKAPRVIKAKLEAEAEDAE